MPKQHPFDEIFRQITELLVNVQGQAVPPLATDKSQMVSEQLDMLEQQLDLFQKITDDVSRESGVNLQKSEGYIAHPEDASQDDRKILETAQKLKGDLEKLETAFTEKISQVKKESKTAGKKRKKKFKRLGGEGWMPL